MAGIYLHVPFCKKACHYCDFHFSTSLVYKKEMLDAMSREIILRKTDLHEPVETIYFGGGTPSLLDAADLQRLFELLFQHYPIAEKAEITLEANPDDLGALKIGELKNTPVNRLSIGIQSFFNDDLQWMNRSHTAAEAESAVKRSQDAGFENITADLIYGYPLLTDEKWQQNLNQLIQFQVPHISAYAMTVEERTPLASFITKGKQAAMDEQQSARQLLGLIDTLEQAGYEQYEIANFSVPGWESGHNSNYWNGVSYLGIGPSAHSFNGTSRQWNIANNARYIHALEKGILPAEVEILTTANRLNEYLMTGLRTNKGIDRGTISTFGEDHLREVDEAIAGYIRKEWVKQSGNHYILTLEGKLFADHIASALMAV